MSRKCEKLAAEIVKNVGEKENNINDVYLSDCVCGLLQMKRRRMTGGWRKPKGDQTQGW